MLCYNSPTHNRHLPYSHGMTFRMLLVFEMAPFEKSNNTNPSRLCLPLIIFIITVYVSKRTVTKLSVYVCVSNRTVCMLSVYIYVSKQNGLQAVCLCVVLNRTVCKLSVIALCLQVVNLCVVFSKTVCNLSVFVFCCVVLNKTVCTLSVFKLF